MLKVVRLVRVVPILLIAAPAFAQAPNPPQTLTSTVNGTTVTLTWAAPAGGGAPTGYSVEASFTPGGPVIATLPVLGPPLMVPNVPLGTYFVRVRALNGSGISGPSNEVTVAVGTTGCPATPLPPALRVQSIAQQATVNWGSSGGCAPTNYTLFAGSAPGLSNVAVVNAGGQLALSATAPSGTYYVRVVGANAFGSAGSQELTVRVAPNAETYTLIANEAARVARQPLLSGSYQVNLVWDDPTINLDIYLTTPGCTTFPPTACQLGSSLATNTNTEQIIRNVTAGQNYELWIANLSDRTTSFTIFNTIGGTPTLPLPPVASQPTGQIPR
jgi:hypothetical protein